VKSAYRREFEVEKRKTASVLGQGIQAFQGALASVPGGETSRVPYFHLFISLSRPILPSSTFQAFSWGASKWPPKTGVVECSESLLFYHMFTSSLSLGNIPRGPPFCVEKTVLNDKLLHCLNPSGGLFASKLSNVLNLFGIIRLRARYF
jgi:hypothetical protein